MLKIFRAETSDVFPGITPRNKAAFDYEQFIHRTFYPFIIHPYSRFRVYYEIALLVLTPCQSFVFFFIWFFFEHNSLFYQILVAINHFFIFTDIVLTFFSGYVESDTEIVVLDPKKIIVRYLLRFFILDVFPAIPWEFLLLIIDKDCTPRKKEVSLICQVFTLLALISMMFRFAAFLRYSRNTSRIMCWNPFLSTIISIPYIYIQIILTQLGFLLIIEKRSLLWDEDVLSQMLAVLDMFVWFALDLILIGTAFPVINTGGQMLILIVTFITSVCFTAYLIKYILGRMKLKENIFLMESRVKRFAQKKHLPILLKYKALLYLNILLQNKYHKEEEIFHHVPDTYKADIFFHFCLPLLKGFHPFEDFPTYVLRRLAEHLKYQLYLPNQQIITNEKYKLRMYFIQRGAVALYSSKHVELYHFETGSSINGRYMIEGKPNISHYVISIEVTEIYCLDHKDFIEVMKDHPKLMEQVKQKLNLSTTSWL